MALDLTGKVIQVLPMQTGTSARGEWKKQEFILETEEQYPRKVCISLWGDKIGELASISPNETITASLNIESREYQGRWYTEVRAWRIQKGTQAQVNKDMPLPPPVTSQDDFISESDSSFDDLPF